MGDNPTMPAIRPVVAVAILLIFSVMAWAQVPAPDAAPTPPTAPAPAPADSGTLANNAIIETILKLRARHRIAARIEQTVDMLNQRFELKGFYFKDSGNRIRLQLDLQGAGDNGSTMLQVCDGKTLWEYQKVMGMKNYRKRDIVPILKKLEEPGLDDDFRTQVMTQLGFGGPEALLLGFQTAIVYDQFAEKADKETEGVPSYVLGGKWKDRAGLFGANDRPLRPTDPLPPYIPSNIRVFIDKATSWPYRIEMIGVADAGPKIVDDNIDPATGRAKGRAKPQPKINLTNITLRYTLLPESEIKPDEQFVFATPRDATNLIDETEPFLAQLDQFIQFKLQDKKAKDAASEAAGEPLIKVPPVDLPTPPPIDTNPPVTPR